MPSVKTIYFHIGCGKTGSSALQVWFSNMVEPLRKQGFSYPLHGGAPLDDYSITSGNGTGIVTAIQQRDIEKYIKRWHSQLTEAQWLFSSEKIQLLTADDWAYFLEYTKSRSIEVHVIAFVRDVYDIAYSSYLQLVKRHTYTGSFSDYALKQKSLRQFHMARLLSQIDVAVSMFHYNEVMRREGSISPTIARVLGIDTSTLPAQSSKKVNRSLTVYETQFMREANRLYWEAYQQSGFSYSAELSNRLIAQDPEIPTGILLDNEVLAHITDAMQHQVNMVNKRFLKDATLEILNKDKKNFCNYPEALSDDFRRVIRTLVSPLVEQYHPDNLDFKGRLKSKKSVFNSLLKQVRKTG